MQFEYSSVHFIVSVLCSVFILCSYIVQVFFFLLFHFIKNNEIELEKGKKDPLKYKSNYNLMGKCQRPLQFHRISFVLRNIYRETLYSESYKRKRNTTFLFFFLCNILDVFVEVRIALKGTFW